MAERSESGFTLVEMLVALSIFALLSAAGVAVLRTSIDTQSAVERRLFELGSIGRVHAMLASDLGQAVDRPTRDRQNTRAAFYGTATELQLVRAGWSNLDESPRSDLQRVAWRLDGGAILRFGFQRLDGSQEAIGAGLARARSAAFRYRLADGNWSAGFAPTAQAPLPSAVELTLEPGTPAALTMVFALR